MLDPAVSARRPGRRTRRRRRSRRRRAARSRTARRRRCRSAPRARRPWRARRSARRRCRRRSGRRPGISVASSRRSTPCSRYRACSASERGGACSDANTIGSRTICVTLTPSCVSEAVISQPMKPPPITTAVSALVRAARGARASRRACGTSVAPGSCARPRAGREHDRVRLDVVERRDRLAEPQVDACSAYHSTGWTSASGGLGLAAEEPLRERRPVIRAVRVLRPDRDLVLAARFAVALDQLCRGQAASDDPDHLFSLASRFARAVSHRATVRRMAVLIASSLRKELSGDVLFDGVSFKVERRDRLALAGPNGAGQDDAAARARRRDLARGRRAGVGEGHAHRAARPAPAVGERAAAARLRAVGHRRPRRGRGGAAGARAARWPTATTTPATLRRYAAAQARLEHAGGYDWRDRAASVVRGLGFTDDDLDRPLRTFSGGELTRASLARALASQPDLLLLDEPTNHLDIESLEWLEGSAEDDRRRGDPRRARPLVPRGGHDRRARARQRAARPTSRAPGTSGGASRRRAPIHQAKTAARQAEQLARLERFVERFRCKATQGEAGAVEAQADQAHRGRSASQAPDGRRRTLGFEFLKPPRSGRDVLVVEGLALQAGDKPLLDGATFALERGEHVALVGPNGSGKTTLLETLLGRRRAEPRAGPHSGTASRPRTSRSTRPSSTSAARCSRRRCRGTGLKRPEAQKLLGRFLFSGWDEHEKPVAALSGGERRRLALAIVVASGANFLVLDEPTNHLDLESRESLEAALEAFPGTVLLVSHDRALLDAVAEPAAGGRGRPDRLLPGRLGRLRRARRRPRRPLPRRRSAEARAAEAPAEAEADGARARRGGGRAGRGARRRARAEARRRLGRHGARRGAP